MFKSILNTLMRFKIVNNQTVHTFQSEQTQQPIRINTGLKKNNKNNKIVLQ